MKKTVFSLAALLTAALMSISFSLSAQEENKVLAGSPSDNWFIGVGGGVNFVYDNLKLNKPAPAVQLYVGKWFTPAIGFRAGYNGIKDNPSVNTANWFSGTNSFFNHYVHADALWNLRNTYSYKENIVWNPILYLQAGGLLAHQAKSHCWAFGLGGGFQNLFRISDVLNISVDLSATVAPERPYRNYSSGRFIILPTATAGLVFNLGKNKFDRPSKAVVPESIRMVSPSLMWAAAARPMASFSLELTRRLKLMLRSSVSSVVARTLMIAPPWTRTSNLRSLRILRSLRMVTSETPNCLLSSETLTEDSSFTC